jgi:hypothetical protein
MGTFGPSQFGSFENKLGVPYTCTQPHVELFQQDAGKPAAPFTEIGGHGNDILAPVIIMEKRGVESITVDVDRARSKDR